jgi:hypothetical protein
VKRARFITFFSGDVNAKIVAAQDRAYSST